MRVVEYLGMRRTNPAKTAQFWTALIGSWLVVAGMVGFGQQPADTQPPVSNSAGRSRLRVKPSSGQPSSTINNLQGAGSLQSQGQQGLQQNGASQYLQPNAKTDSFNTDKVQ